MGRMECYFISRNLPKQMRIVTCCIALFGCLVSHIAVAERILILGDSLSAAYNIPVESGWVYLLSEELSPKHDLINASVSGETSGGGLARLPRLLEEYRPDWVIIELGGNDGLRGFPLPLLTNNLIKIGELARDSGAKPAILGIRIPPNYGARYANSFQAVFPDVAKTLDAPYLDLFMESFISNESMMQDDGLHPTEAAQPIIADYIGAFLDEILTE